MSQTVKTNYPALYTLIVVFFFWGFMAAGNNIFIPFCKDYFHLDQFQSQLIDFAFYTAYYIGALILFATSNIKGRDLVTYWGYKRSIVYGLLFSTIGAVAMILAVEANVYYGMLLGLFTVALGFSLQQTAANPFAILLGDEKTGASRVNLGGGINSLGTTIGPLVVAFALFGTTAAVTDNQIKSLSLDKVVLLYVCVGLLFVGAAALFYFSKKLPEGKSTEVIEKAPKALNTLVFMTVLLLICFSFVFSTYRENIEVISKETLENTRVMWLSLALIVVVLSLLFAYNRATAKPEGWGAMKYPQLVLGMLAIFMYVGVEVGIGSNLGELLKSEEFGGLTSSQIAPYISMYWGSMMIGRWAGAVSAFNLTKNKQLLLTIILPIIAFGIIITANILAKYDMHYFYAFIGCVLLQIILIILTKNTPAKTLMVFSLFGIIALIVGLTSTDKTAIYAFLCGGLACSIMWPAIYNLSLMGLGKYAAQGSSFLVMMILGGGIIPPIQGKFADIIGIHSSYIVSLVCFVYLLIFAFVVVRILKKQNITIE
ncbi:MFS transporter [Flavobacterium sp. xlx-214]|uniref:sugar MFS transporter n=1 Tax=unclassified Flavobacterium TaxID=196869 RepID=UPI0013D3F2D9|nr:MULTISPECIES: sugar MFS transporter [unclassified Flavobacterium]MBA5791802.1 MFS transporter [Flavobacterium sp. xlx-221]QMI83039.1 MFS transporter [Flavobacterium sp. xlx-214]